MSAIAATLVQSSRDAKSDFKSKAQDGSELEEERIAQALQRLEESDSAAASLWREQVKNIIERNKETKRLLETHRISAQLNVSHMQIAKEEVIERALMQQETTLRVQFENELKTMRGEVETTQRKAETRLAAAVAKAEANELKLKEEFATREHELKEELIQGKNRERQLERKVGAVELKVKDAQAKFENEAKLREVLMGETVNMSADLRRQADQAAHEADEARKAAAAATEKLEKALAALRRKDAECTEILASVQQGSGDTLDMRASYEQKLRELEKAHAEELRRRESAHEEELSRVRAAHDRATEETAELRKRAMRERQLACERLLQSRHGAHAEELAEKDALLAAAEGAAAAALEAAAAEHEAALEACRADGQCALDEAVAKHAAEMEQRASLEKREMEMMRERLLLLQDERDAAVHERDGLVPRVEELSASVEELTLAKSALEEKVQFGREASKYVALAASVAISALGTELSAAEQAMHALREGMASQTQQFRKKVQETTAAAGNALRLAEDRAVRSRIEVKTLTLSLAKADDELQTTLGSFAEANRALLAELEEARAVEREARGAAQRAAEARRQDKLEAEAERRRSDEAAAKMLADAGRRDTETMLLRQEMGDEMGQLVRSSKREVSRCKVELRLLRSEMDAEAEAEADAFSAEFADATAEAHAEVDRCVADLRASQAESARLRQQLSQAEETRKSLERVSVELQEARATATAKAASLADQLRDAMASAKQLQELTEKKLSLMEKRQAKMEKRLAAGSAEAVEEEEIVDETEIERASKEMNARFTSATERLRELVEIIGVRFGRLASLLCVGDDVNTRALLSSCLAPLGALPPEEKPKDAGTLSCNGKKIHKSASAAARPDPISMLRHAIDFGSGSVCSKENEPEVASPTWRPHSTTTRQPPPARPFRAALPRAAAFVPKRTHEMAPKPNRKHCADARPEPLSPLPARWPRESLVRESAALHTVQSAPELEGLPQQRVGPGRSPVRKGGGFSSHATATYAIGSCHEALMYEAEISAAARARSGLSHNLLLNTGADFDNNLLKEIETVSNVAIPKYSVFDERMHAPSELPQVPSAPSLPLAESPFATRALLPALGASRETRHRGSRGRADIAAPPSPSRKKAAETARSQRVTVDKPVRLRTAPDVDVNPSHQCQETGLAGENAFIGLGRTMPRGRQQQPPEKAWKGESADTWQPDAWSAEAASAQQEDIVVTTM